MKFSSPLLTKLGGFAVAALVERWMCTLDYQWAYYDPSVDPARPEYTGPVIWVFWHENLLIPLYLRSHTNAVMLLSQHRDAQWLAEVARYSGLGSVRGSTNRGSGPALMELLQKCRHKNIAITPDGPRGPRRQLAQGPIWLAAKSGLPLVAAGMGYDRPYRLPTWDRFAIPRLYSRSRAIISPPMFIPADVDRDGVEYYRQRVERLLNYLGDEAEAWAESGKRIAGQESAVQQACSLETRRRIWPRQEVTPADVFSLVPRDAA